MKKLGLLVTAATMVAFAGGAMAASAKFAAVVNQAGEGMHLLHSGVADTDAALGSENEADCEAGDTFIEYADAGGTCVKVDATDDILTTVIRTANKKDLLIGVSLQSSLYTDTSVKGKRGSSEKAGAEAGILVRVEISGLNSDGGDAKAYPEEVVFNRRVQELSAVLGGVIESCTVSVDESGDGTINIANDCIVTDEEIGLILSTTAANHFNFVAPNLAPGDHTVTISATALASAAFLNGFYEVTNLTEEECDGAGGSWNNGTCTFETSDNNARAWALISIGTLTVEEVRATNNPDGITIDLDAGFCYDSEGDKTDCQ